MRQYAAALCLFFVFLCAAGCAAESGHISPERTTEAVRTFAPENETEKAEQPGQRGVLKSLLSPNGNKTAYIYTMNAAADPVIYDLKISDADKPFSYEEGTVLYSSSLLFDIEWGDESSLMVSLNERETDVPSAVMAEDSVMIMFGRVSAAQP